MWLNVVEEDMACLLSAESCYSSLSSVASLYVYVTCLIKPVGPV